MLELRGVHLHGPRGDRLKNIDLIIKPGERVVLIGSSGAGKSSLLAIANGSVLPDSGTVLWRGRSLNRRHHSQKQAIGTLWQDLCLVEELNVAQNVNAGALGKRSLLWALANLLAPIEINRCRECLEAVGLPAHLASASLSELSGGQRQRVALARLLRQKPEIVLADEPLSSLDPPLAEAVLNLLLNNGIVLKNGLPSPISMPNTLLMSLHQTNLIDHFDRVIGLRSGQLVVDQSTDGLNQAALEWLYQPT